MTAIHWQRLVVFTGVIVASLSVPATAQVLESDALQRKQEDQQRARTLTRDLLSGVLDIQLRQLEENGLSDQEIFRDIKLMRQNLNHLIETEMSNVVDLLAEAQRLPKEKREVSFVEARQQIRMIVRQLAIERQNLLKRLKMAELAEQTRRLIRHQLLVQTLTKRLPTEPQARQEALTLKAIEDQRDVKELFLQLVDTMVDMKSWSGTLAAAAADGLRILKASDVGKHLDDAGRNLQSVKYDDSHREQELVLKGLNDLLKVIERAQGALNSEKLASLDRVRLLADAQKQLRDETKKLPDGQQPPSEMVERQSQLQKEIARLQESVRNNAKAETHIQQAETAALDAAASLLDNKQDQALTDQGRVLGNLAALESALKEQAKEQSQDKSADEMANLAKALTQTKAALAEAQRKQDETEKKARTDALSAAPEAKEVAGILERTKDQFSLPAAVETALSDASQSAQQQARILESALPEKATIVEEKSSEIARNALDRAINAVDAALADTQRKESAIKIGELARAAEVLERAAAEERAIAKEAMSLTQPDPSHRPETANTANDLARRQENLKTIASKAAEAIARTAPEASKNASEAAKHAQESETGLQSLAAEKSADPQNSANQAAESAAAASQKLADAAREIRQEIVATAKDLARRASAQADKLADARTAVESRLDQLPSNDAVADLEAAKGKLSEAMQEQAKAQGKPTAAASIGLANQIAKALDAQDSANAAAAAAESGIGSDLKATTQQEEVAENSQAAAELASKRPQAEAVKKQGMPDALVKALNDAQQSAAQAAKQTLDGDRSAADTSRKAAEAALKQAMNLAQGEANSANAAPPSGPPDKQSQSKAVGAATAARESAAKASPAAGNAIAPAVAATQAAEQTLSTDPQQAPAAQSKSAEALRDAGVALDAAIQKAAIEKAKALSVEAKENTSLANRVASVDPAAAAAVKSAANAAKVGSTAGNSPRQMTAAANFVEMALEHAAADLGAKEQEAKRDQAIAESVANLVQDQQSAAGVIAHRSAELEKMDATPETGDSPTAAQRNAAQTLNDAQGQFADSQRATGQGAVELSGQNQVANPPLREALELASTLPAHERSRAMLAESMPFETDGDQSEGRSPSEGTSPSQSESPAGDGQSPSANGKGEAAATGRPSPGKPASEAASGLGTGFVPKSPQLTAEMMAGPKAQNAAIKALGQQSPVGQGPSKSQSSPTGQSVDPSAEPPNASSNQSSSKLTKKSGSTSVNQKVKQGSSEKQKEGTDAAENSANRPSEKDQNVLARQLKEEAWFAKLPPELRKSIRAGVGQKPPRAYEERLKKYFESVD